MSGGSPIGRASGLQPEGEGSNPSPRSKLIIVGGGLAGSMLSTLAAKRGFDSLIIDSGEDWAASRASGMLTVASWIKSHGAIGERGMELLLEHWPMQELFFLNGSTGFHLHMDDVLCRQPLRDKVQFVANGHVNTEHHGDFEGIVVVAAGVWSSKLIQGLAMRSLAGHSLVFKGTWPDKPVLKMWAPYKHMKIFQWGPNLIWYGDSIAIQERNYHPVEMELASLARARKMGLLGSHTTLRGFRPVVKNHPSGLVERISGKLWVLTGGGKMGLTLYPALAERLLDQL